MEIIKVTPRGYCKGVVRAINMAKQATIDYPDQDIYVLGMLVHNTYVMEALKCLNIHSIDSKDKTRMELLDEINHGVVIFTAHGISENVIVKAKEKGLICIDASCPDVVKTQNIVKDYLNQNYEVLYIGKAHHPEAEAVISLSEHVHLIEKEEDLNLYQNFDKLFVTNQTTMSIFDIAHLFDRIKAIYPHAVICEEICNATRIRQEAISTLENIDVLYVVGDAKSNNSNRLASIAKNHGIHNVYLIDDVTQITPEQFINCNRIAITSGASTPTYLTNQVIQYLENYDKIKEYPKINIQDIL